MVPPCVKQIVGRGSNDNLPNKRMTSIKKYLCDYLGKVDAYFRSNPPLKNLNNETVTNAVGP
jgi:hypothetical protein